MLYQTIGERNQESNIALKKVKLSILVIVVGILKIRPLRKIHVKVQLFRKEQKIPHFKNHISESDPKTTIHTDLKN